MSHPSATTIHLLPQEELSALLDRLANTTAEHITLFLPDKSVVGQGLIGLQIVADEAKKINKTLVISSDSPQIQRLAKRVGLEVAGTSEAVPEHGFVAGADVAELSQPSAGRPSKEPEAVTDSAATAAELADPTDSGLAKDKQADRLGQSGQMSRRSAVVAYFKQHGWKWGLAAVILVLLIGGGLVYALDYYLPHATVTVFAKEQSLDRDVNVVADPNATTANVNTLTIPATPLSATASKTQTFPATGKKDVGTKATGSVTIYNKTTEAKTFSAGTVLASDGKQFVLAAAVTVEAATIETGQDPITLHTTTVTTPGSAEASVTAADIGEAYNLGAKSIFTVAKFDDSSFSGRNDQALAGGTKKSVKVVTAEDQSGALDSLDDSLSDEALQALQAKVPTGQELLKDAVTQETTTKEYSQAVGDQADDFSLTLEVEASGLSIKEEDVKTMLNTEVATKVPDGYRLDTEHSTITNHVVSTDEDGAVRLTSTYSAQVIPEVDVEAMRKAIAGKNPSVVEEYLKSQPNLHGYDITLTPKLPGPFYHLPSLESHITIEVQVK
jgi:hypothetical protein